MIYRLDYCNAQGDELRLDIQYGSNTVVNIEGTGNPLTLNYKGDKDDKSLNFLTSSADISLFETEDFNIDMLKTSSETAVSVKYYVNSNLFWQGYVIPDFFSKEITGTPIINMVASDRLSTLKSVSLASDTLPSMITFRELAIKCLQKTGLSLPLKTIANFSNGTGSATDGFFTSKVLTQRLSDTKGRNISCYDILDSLLTASGSKLMQRGGEWVIINKDQHERGVGTAFNTPTTNITPTGSHEWSEVVHNFSDINVGGRRTIIPVASRVGVYQEFGGSNIYPENYNFSDGLTGWTAVNGFVAAINNKEVIGYTGGISNFDPIYGDDVETNSVINKNALFSTSSSPYLKSENIGISYPDNDNVNVTVEVNATGVGSYITNSFVEFAIIATNTVTLKQLSLSNNGVFETMTADEPHLHRIKFPTISSFYNASTGSLQVEGALIAGDENLGDYDIHVRIYGSGESRTSFINSATIKYSVGRDTPRGNLYKTAQGSNFTKQHDIKTTIFGDYIRGGVNGYFYNYPIDDTSSIYNASNELTSLWTTPTAPHDTSEQPLLLHIARQKARMFSIAHDLLDVSLDIDNFDPLKIFVDCFGRRYVVVASEYDLFRSRARVTVEQIAFDGTIFKQDFIYSYFGEGEDTIKSVGGIAGGIGGGGVDLGIIGGINDRIDDVGQRVDDIKVGASNLLRNTGFLGDFNPLEVDALTAVLEETPVYTNPLAHWVHANVEVIDAPSRSGKGVRIGSLQQNVNLRAGERYVLSFMAKGVSLTVNLVEDIEVELTNEFEKYSFDVVAPSSGSFIFWITDASNTAEVYEIMLSEGNTDVDYAYAAEDDLKAIAQLQAINAITSVIKDFDTEVLGGLILTSMIQLGKYKDDVMEKVNAGINGIYNNDNDPAIWAGGSFDDAIRTVQKFIDNPNVEPSDAEWEEMANIVLTHGGDGFFRGYVYALGGMFRGKVTAGSGDSEIVLDPESSSVKYMRNGKLVGETFFTASGWVRTQYYEFWTSGELKGIVSMDSYSGFSMQTFLEDGITTDTMTSHFTDGRISNPNLLDLTDTQADEILASGEWYRTGRIVKVKM